MIVAASFDVGVACGGDEDAIVAGHGGILSLSLILDRKLIKQQIDREHAIVSACTRVRSHIKYSVRERTCALYRRGSSNLLKPIVVNGGGAFK